MAAEPSASSNPPQSFSRKRLLGRAIALLAIGGAGYALRADIRLAWRLQRAADAAFAQAPVVSESAAALVRADPSGGELLKAEDREALAVFAAAAEDGDPAVKAAGRYLPRKTKGN